MSEDDAREDERMTIEEARRRGGAGDGIDPDAPSFPDETGTTDLGVNEPAVNLQSDEDGSMRRGEEAAEPESEAGKSPANRHRGVL
ncbi:MAG: hypothetical protein QOF73_3608 [Thermomicrobiales bacterium]|nr:hypothetical protein [Thermomicrobiales bacterium]